MYPSFQHLSIEDVDGRGNLTKMQTKYLKEAYGDDWYDSDRESKEMEAKALYTQSVTEENEPMAKRLYRRAQYKKLKKQRSEDSKAPAPQPVPVPAPAPAPTRAPARPKIRLLSAHFDAATMQQYNEYGLDEDHDIGYNTYEVYTDSANKPIAYDGKISRKYPDLRIYLDFDGSYTGTTHTNAESIENYSSIKDLIKENMGTRSNPFTNQAGSGFDSGMTWKADPSTLIIRAYCLFQLYSKDINDFMWLLRDPECPIDTIVVDFDEISVTDAQMKSMKKIYSEQLQFFWGRA